MSKVIVVVDMNKIFSALIRPYSGILEKFLDERFRFSAPNFIIIELFKHRNRVFELSPLNEEEFIICLKELIERIDFVMPELISLKNHVATFDMCREIDPQDVPYVSLALHLNCNIWSGDKRLKQGLQEKGVNIFTEI